MDRVTRTVVNAMKTPVKRQIQEGQWLVSYLHTQYYAQKIHIVRRTPKTVSICWMKPDGELSDHHRYKIRLDEKNREYIQTCQINCIVETKYYLNNSCVHFDTYTEMDKITDWKSVCKDKCSIIKDERIKKKRTAKMLYALVRTKLPLDIKKYITQWF